jgi:AraC-like DNA-binding protein
MRLTVTDLAGCRPPRTAGAHVHDFFALVHFEGAGGWHRAGAAVSAPRAGDLVAIPPGVEHDYDDEAAVHGTVVSFMADAVAPGASRHLPVDGEVRAVSVPPAERGQLRATIDALREELEARPLGFQTAAQARLTLILVLLSRLAGKAAGGSHADPVVADVVDLIDGRFAEPLSVASVAAEVARSPRHLSRTVRDLTGKTVMQLIDDRRMEEARRLLLDTSDKVDVIACAVGYRDGSYFTRRFNRAHGVPPSTWRQLHR